MKKIALSIFLPVCTAFVLGAIFLSSGATENAYAQGRLPGDCNNDGSVNLTDFRDLVTSYGTSVPANTGCDFNGNATIDLSDFRLVIQYYNTTGTPVPTQGQGSTIEVEAESGTLTAPMQAANGYIFQTTRNTGGISGNGRAVYTVNIQQAGDYIVQGLVSAASIDNNSYFINFDTNPASNQVWIIRPTGGNFEWQNANLRLGGGSEDPELDPAVFTLTQGQHSLILYGREPDARIDKLRIVPAGQDVPVVTPQPTVPGQPTTAPTVGTPQPTVPVTPFPTLSGLFPCGRFPNASPGCMAVSYQAWMRDVPGTGATVPVPDGNGGMVNRFVDTMSVDFTPLLCHWHVNYNVPWQASARQPMAIPLQYIRYNCPDENNPIWIRAQDQGDTYEQFNTTFPTCQTGRWDGRECVTEHVYHVRASEFSHCTEIRVSPNDNNSPITGGGGSRWYNSTNWQTCPGYRSSWELTNRENSGSYLRMIHPNADKYLAPNQSIPTVSGTISIPIKTSGGTGGRMKVFIFLDPSQHKTLYGTQTGYTLMEHEGFFNGNFTWDTRTLPAGKMANGQATPAGTPTPNGVHSVLYIIMEGNSKHVKASGIARLINIQN